MKLSEAIAYYWQEKMLQFSETTIPGYTKTFDRFIAFVDDVEIEAVTSADIRRFLLDLKTRHRLSKRTVSDSWVPLSSLWTWAERELGIDHVIRSKVKRPPFTKKTVEPFTGDEMRGLLAVLWEDGQGADRKTAYRDRALVLTMLDTGARASEMCALRLEDANLARGTMHIRHGKGDKARFVVVGNVALEALRRYLQERGDPAGDAPLFASRYSGDHLNRDALRHLLARLGKRAGIQCIHPHKFRHTFAIQFLRNGGNAIVLQGLLGHSDPAMTQYYVKLAMQDFEAARKHAPADHWNL